MRKIFMVVLLLSILFFGLRFDSVLPQEGNPIPYLLAISKYEISNNGYEKVLEKTNEIRYISKFDEKQPLSKAKEFMKTYGWEFKEQVGSGLIFKKDNEAITIGTRQYSKHYFIWIIPKEVLS
ncbi:hypothetical protein ABEW00_02840 [Rossellomorea vietnamensis]|uniref:hypothetical protein n=1 Tax=Rossellomorea vietnamensis TaxID=218284 RepID=UPI003D289DC6